MAENTTHSTEAIKKYRIPREIPLLVTSDVVVYPYMAAPLLVEDEPAIQAVDAAVKAGHKVVAIFGEKPQEVGDAESVKKGSAAIRPERLYPVGTAVQVVRMMRLPGGPLQMLVQGIVRVGLEEVLQTDPHPLVRVEERQSWVEQSNELEALSQNVINLFQRALSLAPNVPKEVTAALDSLSELDQKADFIASQLNLSFDQRMELLGEFNLRRRLEIIHGTLTREVEILEIRQKIQSEAAGSMDKAQREYFLRQQLRAIKEELGEGEEGAELEELREQVEKAGMPEEAKVEAERELSRMEKMPQSSAEYTVSRTYLDWLVNLPWNLSSDDHLDVDEAERVLDEDHYGLEKPKERILEYLAVRRLKNDMRGPILCLAGPPGTGKTSLGRSIARAMGREFVRISLGGARDESEVRGHRRTYVGALPGRIIQGLRRAGTNNPVFMLDEIDKLGADFRGDPSSALLEVLDPEQNNSFVDHYLDVQFDLSNVLFIATANSLHTIPPALLDRMEVLQLSGYTEAEKLKIARQFLAPRQVREHGLTDKRLELADEALLSVIRHYTREAGLRNLEREVGTLCRKVARKFAQGRRRKLRVREEDLHGYLGPQRYRYEIAEEESEVGVVTGLAWTPVGGEVLFIEGALMPGRGALKLTGQLGDVMRESAEAAMTYVRSRWQELDLPEQFNEKRDVHIHVPAGAVPKDGPSAGVTMGTVLTSVFTGRPVRKDVAMTGEITLRGKVLPIGGVRDKVMAAHRAGIKTVILPEDNRKDVEEIPETVRKGVKLVFAGHMDQVIDTALYKRPKLPGARLDVRQSSGHSGDQKDQLPVAATNSN